jgi:uncharacterized damage-inducible protein DinB
MPISQSLLPEFDQEMANTRKILERLPDDKFDYKPHDKSMTLGRLAGHVAEIPGWGKATMEAEVLDIPPDFKPVIPTSRQAVLDTFDKNVKESREYIAKASDQDLMKIWKLLFAGNEIFSMQRVAVLRGMVMNHLIHHRAQLGLYLRLNDIPVPGMYGPSADEPQGFGAQA